MKCHGECLLCTNCRGNMGRVVVSVNGMCVNVCVMMRLVILYRLICVAVPVVDFWCENMQLTVGMNVKKS